MGKPYSIDLRERLVAAVLTGGMSCNRAAKQFGVGISTAINWVNLLPTLRPGDIVIMDNLGSHKSKAVRQLIRSVGAKLLFLPKYSPELNPIEQVFAKLKHFLRQAAARTVEAVCAAIGEILQAFTPEECANYFQNSGYSLT
jgi:transposase